jgi:rhodanese-related sulfurtransferase
MLEKIAAGKTVVDVRSAGELSSGAYPNARRIQLDALGSRTDSVGQRTGASSSNAPPDPGAPRPR